MTIKRTDIQFMKRAISEARLSKHEDDRSHPFVGVVVVKNRELLSTAHRGELGEGNHAEYTALEQKLPRENLSGATVYTTLEPCTARRHPKVPCAERLVERKVARVVIGMLDPNPKITGKGWLVLRAANIETDFFSNELMVEVEELNRSFTRQHRSKSRSRINKAELELMAEHVTNLLREKGWRRAGFERIREHVNPKYTDELLFKMIDRMPHRFRLVILANRKPAVAFSRSLSNVG
jgi:pyrimidine deaminase RibD-like protein